VASPTPLVQSAAVANIKSQIKRNRQNEARRVRNKTVRTALKTSVKKVRTAVGEGDALGAQQELRQTIEALDKAASKGALHTRAAARRKSRLARAVNAASSGE
jgi:small subunit ribosomal protein S20